MIDPADSRTLPLEKPTRVHFTTDARIYTVVLEQDLLGDWRLTQSWLSRNGKRGGKSQLVESFAQGMALLDKLARNRVPEPA
ncbi:hypothetical protein [Noviherbaspirillum sp.]|uniref:hypothetical protein n=1 Tax=Noviherbaspirillum sp. TaxID=1926288 RepID=UPI002D360AD1|nr:hypothetical protein [Noviherbaspirillum sp.]HZW21942.1 hypothetical protein [Noviherbaspirillum sp.]